ncbi:hypothetical protein SAMN02746065_112103 [Desulfocicer vacuolatum DSM 3385]|uniref:Uncharacterized protein n=1 Tax=Desulfocicer vacuolatum DSM 3385 TaxID=1121400 RepID=A0A1W2CK60_9BACT|nr:hypothetical protein SAMN02746065_112103 [Desulfocicer vacuolatum DSM 3385]
MLLMQAIYHIVFSSRIFIYRRFRSRNVLCEDVYICIIAYYFIDSILSQAYEIIFQIITFINYRLFVRLWRDFSFCICKIAFLCKCALFFRQNRNHYYFVDSSLSFPFLTKLYVLALHIWDDYSYICHIPPTGGPVFNREYYYISYGIFFAFIVNKTTFVWVSPMTSLRYVIAG